MKKSAFIIGGITILIFLLPAILYHLFAIGMIYTNSPKPIKLEWVNKYKDSMRTEFSNIEDIKVYYQQGRINFEFDVSHKMNFNQCKLAVKSTKDFIVKQNDLGALLPSEYGDEVNLLARFTLNNDVYEFNCPYFIQAPDVNDNPNETIKNDFKVWYMRINSQSESKLEL